VPAGVRRLVAVPVATAGAESTLRTVRRLAVLTAFVAALALVVGAQASAAERLVRHTVPGDGVSLSVPASWVALDHRDVLSEQVLAELSRENPQLAPLFTALRSGSIRFLAADPKVRQRFATNVNIVVSRAPAGLDFNAYRGAIVAQLDQLPSVAGPIRTSVVTLPTGKAVRVRYGLKLVARGRKFTTATLQYGFLRRGRSIVVTYTTLPTLAGTYDATFAASASSIRLT
jgi:hypothetical protein